MEYLPYGLLVLELYLGLCRVDVYVDVFRVYLEVNEVGHLLALRHETLVSVHHGLMEVRMLHETAVDEEVLACPFLAGRLWLACESGYLAYRRLDSYGQ